MPRGVHGSGPGSPSTSRPRFTGCRPSASLTGSTRSSAAPASSPRGSGSCTMNPVQAGSALSSSMARSTSAWVAVGRQLALQRGDPDLGAVAVLAAHVGVRAGVVADQQGAQPRGDPGRLQLRDPAGELAEDVVEGGLAVHQGRRHDRHSDHRNPAAPGAGSTDAQAVRGGEGQGLFGVHPCAGEPGLHDGRPGRCGRPAGPRPPAGCAAAGPRRGRIRAGRSRAGRPRRGWPPAAAARTGRSRAGRPGPARPA